MNPRRKVALVLGGGGVRSFSAIGVLKVFKKEKIPVDLVVGASMGAIIGAIFSLSNDINPVIDFANRFPKVKGVSGVENFFSKRMEKRFLRKKWMSFLPNLLTFSLAYTRNGFINSKKTVEYVYKYFGKKYYFSQCKVPFACVAVDLKSGKLVILNDGEIIPSLVGSCAVPGIFKPLNYKNYLLVDGGVLSGLPIMSAHKLGAKIIIGVDCEEKRKEREDFKDCFQVLFRTSELRGEYTSHIEGELSDFLIKPDLGDLEWFRFSKGNESIEKGKEEAIKSIDKIKSLIQNGKEEKYRLRERLIDSFEKWMIIKK